MEKFLQTIAPYRKSVVAFIVAQLQVLSLYVGLVSNGLSPEDIQAIIASEIIALGGTAAVYNIKNKGDK